MGEHAVVTGIRQSSILGSSFSTRCHCFCFFVIVVAFAALVWLFLLCVCVCVCVYFAESQEKMRAFRTVPSSQPYQRVFALSLRWQHKQNLAYFWLRLLTAHR